MKHINKLFFTCILSSLSICQFDWSDNGIGIRQGYHIEWQRTADVGNNGEIIFAWSDTRDGGRDIYAKKIDTNGNELWNSEGQVIVEAPGRQEDPQLVNDGNGGAYVIWKDYRDEPDDGDFYAQHILSDGSLAWDPLGVALTSVSGKQTSPNLCVDGQGGAFAIWKDESLEAGVPPLYGTHLGPNQEDIINPGVGVLLNSSNLNYGGVSLEVSAAGSAILVWSYNINDDDIYAQRIDTSCNTLWSTPQEGGIVVSNDDGNQSSSRVTYYNEQASIVAWEDDRSGDDDIYAQFIYMDGTVLYENDLLVCAATDRQFKPRVKADSQGAIVVWSDLRDNAGAIPVNNHVYAQKITIENGLMWDSEVAIAVDAQSSSFGVDHSDVRLSVDGLGGGLITWLTDQFDDKYDVSFQHIDSSGQILLEENGLLVTNIENKQEAPVVRSDAEGGAFIVWGDYRVGSPGVYLQHIQLSGNISLTDNGSEMFWGIDGNTVSNYAIKPTANYLGNNSTIIAWSDQRAGAGEVVNYGQKIYSNWYNSQIDDGYKLSDYTGSAGQDYPQVGSLGDNIIHLFPTEESFGPSLRYQLLDENLNIIGDDQGQIVSDNQTPQFYDTFKYVNSSNGSGYVVFSEQKDFIAYNVFLQGYDSSGNPLFDQPLAITDDYMSDKNVRDFVEIENLGFMIIYESQSWMTGNKIELVAVDYNGNLLENWGGSILVDNSNDDQYFEDSQLTESGVFIVYNKNDDVYGQMIDFSGSYLGDSMGIPLVVEEGEQRNISAVYNSVLEELLVCYENRINNTYYDISCLSISESGLDNFNTFDIGDLSNVNQVEPFAYATSDGSYLIVWQDDRNYTGNLAGNEDIYIQQITNGNFIFSQNGISVCSENYFPQKKPQIELYNEDSNSYVIYWNDLRSSGKANFTNLYAQSITVSSGPLCTLGDINQDNLINVIDIVSLVNYILGSVDFDVAQLCAADLNGDTIINVIDIVSLVNIILSL